MKCSNCGAELISFIIPEELHEYAPNNRSYSAVCQHCLQIESIQNRPKKTPIFNIISDEIPKNPEVAILIVLLVNLLSSIALNKDKILALIEQIEQKGVDPILILNRLAADPQINPKIDLNRRRSQLLQIIE